MKEKKSIRLISYFIFSSIFIVLFICFLFTFFVKENIEPLFKSKFSELTNHNYTLSFDKLSINLFTECILLNNVSITPVKRNSYSSEQYFLDVGHLKIIDFSLLNYLRTQKFDISKIEVLNSQISVYLNNNIIKKHSTIKYNSSNYLKSLAINAVTIINLNISIYRTNKDSTPFVTSFKNKLSFKNIFLTPKTWVNDFYLPLQKNDIILHNLTYKSSDKLYTLSANKIHLSFIDSLVVVDSLKLVPNYNKKEFALKDGFQISRVGVSSSRVKLIGLDYKKIFSEEKVQVNKIIIDNCFADVYRDNTFPLKIVHRPSLQSMIKNIPFYISIDTILLHNGRLNFEVLNVGSKSIGKVYIDNVSFLVSGISNDTLNYSGNQSINAKIKGRILGKANFTESYVFPLKNSLEFFYCSGTLSAIPLSSFNSIVSSSKHLIFKAGMVDELKFNFVARENTSHGTMVFKYHDLKLELLSGKKSMIKKAKNIILNQLLIHDNNPHKGKDVREVKLFMKHNTNRYFLFYSMQTILSGLEPTIIK